jgi:hypothetical protein
MTVAKLSNMNRAGVRDIEATGLRYLCEAEITRLSNIHTSRQRSVLQARETLLFIKIMLPAKSPKPQ